MPEGPSLVILRELTQSFAGKRVLKAEGNSKIDKSRLVGQRIVALRTWGKHFLIELDGCAVPIHFLMFGSYCIDSRKDRPPRLALSFARGRELNFSKVAAIPPRKLSELIKQPRQYSFDFLEWKKAFGSPSRASQRFRPVFSPCQ